MTLTTVGYGNITPQSIPGQMIASLAMIIGFGIIAVPTGIMTVEISQAVQREITTRACPECSVEGHETNAAYCKMCGAELR